MKVKKTQVEGEVEKLLGETKYDATVKLGAEFNGDAVIVGVIKPAWNKRLSAKFTALVATLSEEFGETYKPVFLTARWFAFYVALNGFVEMDYAPSPTMWDQAIEFLVDVDAIEPTMAAELSQEQLQTVIFNITDCSTYDLISKCGKWIERDGNVADYLSCYFFSSEDVWLAYIMDVHYAKEWDGEDWVKATWPKY